MRFISQCDSVSLRHLPVDCWRQSRVLYQNWLGYLHLKQLKTCSYFRIFQMSKRKANSTAYNGLFVMFTEIAKKPMMVENCSELLFVQCPSPRCGRKAPSLAEIGRKVTVKSNITITTTTTKKPLTFQNDHANLPFKPSSNLQDKFQAFIGTSVQSGNYFFTLHFYLKNKSI